VLLADRGRQRETYADKIGRELPWVAVDRIGGFGFPVCVLALGWLTGVVQAARDLVTLATRPVFGATST
jgi:hypothetical protein